MSQPLLTLPDPRQYHPPVSLTNMLIHNALSVQNATSDADRELWFVAIRDAMAQMLQRRHARRRATRFSSRGESAW